MRNSQMKPTGRHARALAAAIAFAGAIAVLAACGGGPTTAGIDASGVRSPVVAQGPIQGFGSVILNGTHYSVTSAEISVNGSVSSESALAVGQIVTITGSVDAAGGDAVADRVAFDANVEGPVQAVDVAAGTLVVLGQRVSTDSATVFEFGSAGTDLTALAAGDYASVSGLASPDGSIRASWIERAESGSGELRVVGTVSALDTALYRFRINDLLVDYSGVSTLEGFAGGAPQDGDVVRVEGGSLGPNGELVARDLERLEREFGSHEGDGAEIEGLITRFVSPSDFDVSGLPVVAGTSTVYEGGSPASLALGVKIQVEGSVDADGVIVARKIEVKDGGSGGDG
jgi:hypothetical protein